MEKLKDIGKRLLNVPTFLAALSYLLVISGQLELNIDSELVTVIAELICGLLVLLGVMNNGTKGKWYSDK